MEDGDNANGITSALQIRLFSGNILPHKYNSLHSVILPAYTAPAWAGRRPRLGRPHPGAVTPIKDVRCLILSRSHPGHMISSLMSSHPSGDQKKCKSGRL